MKILFVDTAGWVALADESDPVHGASSKARDGHLRRGGHLVTTDYVIDESLTLLRRRLGLAAARRFWWMISESARVRLETVSPDRARRAREWFFSWEDKEFSFTDCTSFVVMKELGLDRALTSDRHFVQAGFQVVPR
jgi:hypothetical protein